MAEEIIDLRDRIEKMRIQIENETVNRINDEKPIEIHHKMSNSNITMSIQNKVDETKHSFNQDINPPRLNNKVNQVDKNFNDKVSFPSVSLSVKNPISSKILVGIIMLQILSNLGILFFLYDWNGVNIG